MSKYGNEPSVKSSGGITFFGALQLIFIVLKLIGKIEWSWWLVLAPTWIELVILIVAAVIFAIIYT